ncbi:MAG: hypothetical protein WC291_07905 [Thermodesulfovibrionales bacterium]|jgi:hypothetical protein
MKLHSDSTLRFSLEKGFGESYFISCPVCGNLGIKIIWWEKGNEEITECLVCRRMEKAMEKGEEEGD